MIETITIIISVIALAVSIITAWLTLFKKGTIRMTQPTLVFFGPDGPGGSPKVYLRTLFYCTAKRGRIVEHIFIKVRRGESVQSFNIWVYGEESLSRGSGLFVGEDGVIFNHHFLLPKDGTTFEFLPGEYIVDAYASLVGDNKPLLLSSIKLILSETHARTMKQESAGVFFDWGPDSAKYHAHVDKPPYFKQAKK
jgi:hypothetical protein